MEDDIITTKIEIENNPVEEEFEEILNFNDIVQDLISSLQSISISSGYKYKLYKGNSFARPSALDSSKIVKNSKKDEIRLLRDEFIYRTVMKEILKNEARIILEKVNLKISCHKNFASLRN